MGGRTRFLDSRTGVSVRMASGLVCLTHFRYFLKSARAPKIPFRASQHFVLNPSPARGSRPPSWQPSAPRKSRVGFWITSEFRHARLRWRRPSSSNFPSPSNDHGQLKLRIGVSPSCCITPSHRAYFHPPPEKLRQTWAALAPSKHKTPYVWIYDHPV